MAFQDQDNDMYQEEDSSSFHVGKLDQNKKSPAIFIGISIGVFIAIYIAGLTFGKYVSVYYKSDSTDLPVVQADPAPDGRLPDTPGGMDVPNRDKLVYDRLKKSDANLPVERLLPAMEKPVQPEPSTPSKESGEDKDLIGQLAANLLAEEEGQAAAVVYEEDGTPVEVMFKSQQTEHSQEKQAAEENTQESINQGNKEKDLKEGTGDKDDGQSPKNDVRPFEPEVFYSVQLVSTRTDSAAEKEWERLSEKFKGIISELPHFITKTVVSNGTFYRLRVGQFETHEEAKALCDQLKTKKQECFVVK